jgi:hypothetical protein
MFQIWNFSFEASYNTFHQISKGGRMKGVHVTLANWYELFYNLNAMTWNQLAPDAHSALLGHKGLIAAILRTRTYQHLTSSHHRSNASEEDVADDNGLVPEEEAGPEAAVSAEDGDVQRSAGLFEAEDSLHAPASQGEHVLQQLVKSPPGVFILAAGQAPHRILVRGVQYFATSRHGLTVKGILKTRSIVRFMHARETDGCVLTNVGVLVDIHESGKQVRVLQLDYARHMKGVPLVSSFGVQTVLLEAATLEREAITICSGQLLNPVLLSMHPESSRLGVAKLMCYALDINADRYHQ